MLFIVLILSCAFCCSFAKFSCKSPYECMTTLDCKQKHGIIKKILVKCAGKSVCCPPLEELELSESETEFTPTEHETSSIGLETTQTDLNLIPVEKCGRRPQYDRMKIFDFGNKVFKGKRVTIGEIPWIVHITAIGSKNDQKFCGGTLINKNYVLTAAHCFPDDVQKIELKLGTIDLNATRGCDGPFCMPIIREGKHFIHEEYGFTKRLNDIAIIRLNESVKFNDFIQPACLPMNGVNYMKMEQKKSFLTAGWGAKGSGNRQSRMLLGTKQSYFNFEDCRKIYEKFLPQEKVAESHICALGKNKSRGLKGDSGGPLLASEKNRFTVVGVLSRGPNNFRHKNAAPVLYTRVDYYLDWILKHITV